MLGRYCGDSSQAPDLVTSSYNHVYIKFVTDGSVQNRGFVLNYTTIEVGDYLQGVPITPLHKQIQENDYNINFVL